MFSGRALIATHAWAKAELSYLASYRHFSAYGWQALIRCDEVCVAEILPPIPEFRSEPQDGTHNNKHLFPHATTAFASFVAASTTALLSGVWGPFCQGEGAEIIGEQHAWEVDGDGEVGNTMTIVGDIRAESKGAKPDPYAWIRPTLRGTPNMNAWLSLMKEVGHHFPAKNSHKEIGVNCKKAYTDFVLLFADYCKGVVGPQPTQAFADQLVLRLPLNVAIGQEAASTTTRTFPPSLGARS